MILTFTKYTIEPIHEKYAWRICDLMVANSDRLKRYFPKTLEQNLNPGLSHIFVEEKVRQYNHKEEFLFVLKEKEDHKVIGLVYIKEIDWKARQAELAYCIGYQYEGKGWMTEAVMTLSTYAFDILGLKVLQIIANESNVGSIKVAEKCGYLWKRTLRKEHTPPGEEPLDMELYELKCRLHS
ncbi:ribosomal-protein-alanine N-acetyltransferase [Pricia antarctica]|uniref:Ribosomal-protein-alanine N-acetyltransferase n=1 Tax=Pricia antarctica TaxID=641691 RepID=A0A1G6WII1_9FLAO|nr:GNAT family protein [Pricia antarctica]SDD65513.1 ribosomal-protein-alanine N-acetyltransferase [Pricia antarctica]